MSGVDFVGPARWLATITYRSDKGPVDVDYAIEEIEDLQGVVESGPNWHTIEHIRLVLANSPFPGMTLERQEEEQ